MASEFECELEGPFTNHAYIGSSFQDLETVQNLRWRLEQRGVSCCLRYNFHAPDLSIKLSIQEGVTRSRKCLLFLTPNYIAEKWYQIETESFLDKARRFSRDTVIILKGDAEVPEKLRGLKQIDFRVDHISDEKYINVLRDEIIQEPKTELAVLPKENIGYGSALGYFYGFLRLVLPDFKKRLIEQTLNCQADLVANTVKKMLIIMPESCFCGVSLQCEGKIEFTGKFVVKVSNRAGNELRDYKSSLFKLKDLENNQEYYFVGELATPLLTLYEMYYFNLAGMTRDQLYTERDVFYYTLKSILSHPDNAECNDQFKILYWSDPATGKPNKLELYDFLLPVLRKELELERRNAVSKKKTDLEGDGSSTSSMTRRIQTEKGLKTSEDVDVKGSNPSQIYERSLGRYEMSSSESGCSRGICLIINIANFDKGTGVPLSPRNGSEKDAENLKKLFKDLHFTVEVHHDIDSKTLESLLLTTHVIDHSQYNAFVCCILTHGKLGVVYTSDGKPIEVLQIVDFFSEKNCSSLKGKPKLFFIQACQRGDDHPAPNRSPPQQQPLSQDGQPSPDAGQSDVGASQSVGDGTQIVYDRAHLLESTFKNCQITDEKTLEADAQAAPSLDPNQNGMFKHKAVLVPGSPDFLMSYSTLPGSISYRDPDYGSLYIQALVEELRRGNEIDRALKLVSKGVTERLRARNAADNKPERFQLPFHLTSGMDRLIYL